MAATDSEKAHKARALIDAHFAPQSCPHSRSRCMECRRDSAETLVDNLESLFEQASWRANRGCSRFRRGWSRAPAHNEWTEYRPVAATATRSRRTGID